MRMTRFVIGAAAAVAAGVVGGTVAGDAVAEPGAVGQCAHSLADQLAGEFPSVRLDSQLRQGDINPEHAEGRAVDVFISNHTDPHQIALGDAIVARVHQLGTDGNYPVGSTLWRQTYTVLGGEPTAMEDRGSDIQNNMEHIHIGLTSATC